MTPAERTRLLTYGGVMPTRAQFAAPCVEAFDLIASILPLLLPPPRNLKNTLDREAAA